jgi:hypothetical protein
LKMRLLERMTAVAVLSAVCLVGISVRASAQDHQDHGKKEEHGHKHHAEKRGHYGRISDKNYRAHFGHEHAFVMRRPRLVGGYHRFAYGGYTFGFREAWPAGWTYNDNVYVEYVGGGYYLCNPRHPGIRISLTIF